MGNVNLTPEAAATIDIAAGAKCIEDVLAWDSDNRRLESRHQLARMWEFTACGRGCNHCCRRTEVHVFPVEVALLHLTAVPDEGYRQRLAKKAPDQTCPLLGADGLCSVYEKRPAACRGEHSLDAAACAAPGGSHPYFDGLLALPHAICLLGQAGFASMGLDTHPVVLRAALEAIVHMEPDEPLQMWLSGARLFDAARVRLSSRNAEKLVQIQNFHRRA